MLYDTSRLEPCVADARPSWRKGRQSATVSSAARVIECSSIVDDFYSSLLDWSGQHLFYSVENVVHCYDFHTEKSARVYANAGTSIPCLKQSVELNALCVGTSCGQLHVVDLYTGRTTRFNHHKSRIGTLETFGGCVATGSRDRRVKIIDVRERSPVAVLEAHTQEVCGVAMNSRKDLIASGGNDNRVYVFDIRRTAQPLVMLADHSAAIRALSWSPAMPQQLVTGGGTADRTLRQWDLGKKSPLIKAEKFDSQICNARWLRNGRVLCTFGYSQDDARLLNDMCVERQFVGHKSRVIHLGVDPKERYFATGSGDGTVRIWELEREPIDIKIR